MRATEPSARIHYKGSNNNFVMFAVSPEAFRKYRKDSSVPLTEVLDAFTVYTTGHHGSQGILEQASHGQLDAEFGTHEQEVCARRVLAHGELKEMKSREREGNTNVTIGSLGRFT